MTQTTSKDQTSRGRRGRGRGRQSGGRPVPLHKRSSSHFQPGDRQRGTDYFHEDRVHLEVEGTRARARVEGTDRDFYGVGVDWSQVPSSRLLHAFCECQRFAGGRPCKHLWATLLALAESESESQPPGRGRLALRKDTALAWFDLGISPNGPGDAAGTPPRRRRVRHARPRRGRAASAAGGGPAGALSWREQLDSLRDEVGRRSAPEAKPAPGPPTVFRFLINATASRGSDGLVVDIFGRRPGAGGRLGRPKRTGVHPQALQRMLEPEESADPDPAVAVVAALPEENAVRKGRRTRRKGGDPGQIRRFRLPRRLYEPVLSHLAADGTLAWWDGRKLSDRRKLAWDPDPPWHLALRLESIAGGTLRLQGSLERNSERVPLSAPVLVLPAGDSGSALLLFEHTLARLEGGGQRDLHWIALLRDAREILIPKQDLEEAFTALLEIPDLPRLEIPEELRLSEESSRPHPRLVLKKEEHALLPSSSLLAELSFEYGSLDVSAGDPRTTVVDLPGRAVVRRDMEAEHQALVRLLEAGVRPVPAGRGHELELSPQELPSVAEPLLLDGWTVEVQGTSLRAPNPPALRVESGIDWFELSGEIDFAGDEVELKQVLEVLARGERFVRLKDGSQGLLPAKWSETYDSLAKLSHGSSEEGLRFLHSQALLVDALLVEMPEAEVDKAFAELREKLRSFERIKPKKEPRGFSGTLRGYQRDGLGWLTFLREFGLGGVLADDMGLGKTVQVLALLRAERTPSRTTGIPWLVVAPRSLVYNWLDEASRFTPKLKVIEYGGPGREALQPKLGDYDLVVTTYGTLRRDVGYLAKVEFDTVVLDEAQAIKNRESLAAKASRLLVARHRLALTGTPIENHLGELGSLFEFLNPGLLGRLPTLEALSTGRAASREELALIAQGIRPFILRRTKEQVLPDLPPKTEQVLLCELSERQRELYDRVRTGYQATLLKQVEAEGLAGSTIQVLEALLRLRQIACHPGLVDPSWEDAGSAKFEALFDAVDEVLDEGHKVIVFSQFTSLLAYVRQHLDAQETTYAYLDGQTRNRGEVVERFQTDPECNLFLISLKAGGLGLNLTAAGYVYLLDPWWNPAVEAQAIDRAHRIGQTQPVFAYRMIARDTVEEKILELQRSKRKIADAILEGEGEPLRELTADDLRMLLS